VSDAPLAIQMLHDRILIKTTSPGGERTTRAGILIPATAEVAKRLVWGEVVLIRIRSWSIWMASGASDTG